jgi:hypothetical protein
MQPGYAFFLEDKYLKCQSQRPPAVLVSGLPTEQEDAGKDH